MVPVARRGPVGRAPVRAGVAHVDGGVEVLGPDANDRGIVPRPRIGAQVVEHVGRKGIPGPQRPGGGGVDTQRLVEVAMCGHVELLLLGDVGRDPRQPGGGVQRTDRVVGAVHDQIGAVDADHATAERERREPTLGCAGG